VGLPEIYAKCNSHSWHSLIGLFGVWHSDFLEIGTKIDIHNNGLLGEGKIKRFCLDVGRIIDNFHFFIVPV